MGQPISNNGRGSLGTDTNSPTIDPQTNARIQNRANVQQGKDRDRFVEDFYYPVGAQGYRLLRWGAEYTFGDKQGRYLLELWLSGTAPDEVTLDSDDWGDYMRAEPDLQKQIYSKLQSDAYLMRAQLNQSDDGQIGGPYQSSFHGEVGRKSFSGKEISGGYLTGYQILHGSKKTDTLQDVQISGKFTAALTGAGGKPAAYKVTFEDLEFVWDDIINVNERYKADRIFANYAKWENRYTSKPQPKDYILHITWKADKPVTINVSDWLPTFEEKQ